MTVRLVTACPLLYLRSLISLLESLTFLSHLKQIHAQTIVKGFVLDTCASSRMVAFCANSGSRDLNYGAKILRTEPNVDTFSWNLAIRGCIKSKKSESSILFYKELLRRGETRPDSYTYPLLFKACANLVLNDMGHEIIGHVLQLGFNKDRYVHNAMIHLLVSIRALEVAHKVFNEGCVRDLVSWNSLIHGYAKSGLAHNAMKVYREMIKEQVKPDEVTMIGLLSSCTQLRNLELGEELHTYIKDNKLNFTLHLANSLIDMYVKCGDLKAGKAIFDHIEKKTVVTWTTMVVGYAKHGMLDLAHKLFHDMPEKNVVAWNAIIGSYVHANRGKESLLLFHKLQANNIQPDRVTMIHCLSACSQLHALDVGTWFHHYIEKHNFSLDVVLGTALVDMYSKCGNITKALQVFHEMPKKNSLTWTAVIGGLALYKDAYDAILYFSRMKNAGLMPDEITYLGVLSACCHSGLIEEGRKYFTEMKTKYNLSPQVKHYSCMVDLLGRVGLLEEAEELIDSMPMEADAAVWGALFFACSMHGNLSLGEKAASKLFELDPHDSGTYLSLANMYREANMLQAAGKVRKMMRQRGVDKIPGCSLIEVNNTVSEFIAGDVSHQMYDQIRECLVWLTGHLVLTRQISDTPEMALTADQISELRM